MGVANTGTSSTRVFPEGSEIVHITLDRLAENMVRRVRQNPSTTKPTLDRTAVHGSGTAVITQTFSAARVRFTRSLSGSSDPRSLSMLAARYASRHGGET